MGAWLKMIVFKPVVYAEWVGLSFAPWHIARCWQNKFSHISELTRPGTMDIIDFAKWSLHNWPNPNRTDMVSSMVSRVNSASFCSFLFNVELETLSSHAMNHTATPCNSLRRVSSVPFIGRRSANTSIMIFVCSRRAIAPSSGDCCSFGKDLWYSWNKGVENTIRIIINSEGIRGIVLLVSLFVHSVAASCLARLWPAPQLRHLSNRILLEGLVLYYGWWGQFFYPFNSHYPGVLG